MSDDDHSTEKSALSDLLGMARVLRHQPELTRRNRTILLLEERLRRPEPRPAITAIIGAAYGDPAIYWRHMIDLEPERIIITRERFIAVHAATHYGEIRRLGRILATEAVQTILDDTSKSWRESRRRSPRLDCIVALRAAKGGEDGGPQLVLFSAHFVDYDGQIPEPPCEGGRMRKLLLANVATLGLMGAAFAQPVGAPTQGQQAWPMVNPTASANNNNNYQAPALPGPLANPTPGTIVIHGNGKVQAEVGHRAN